MAVNSNKKNFGSELSAQSQFNDYYNDELKKIKQEMEQLKRKADAERNERKKKFEQFDSKFAEVRTERLGNFAIELVKLLGLDVYWNLADAVADAGNVAKMNKTGSFECLFDRFDKQSKAFLDCIRNDEDMINFLVEFRNKHQVGNQHEAVSDKAEQECQQEVDASDKKMESLF